MLTPISTARTAAGPAPATSGSSTSTAGKLLTRLDSTAATAAIPSSAGRVAPIGNTSRIAASNPLSITVSTTTPSARTNARNGTLTARRIPARLLRRWIRPRTPSPTEPANAAQAGEKPASDVAAKPASVRPSTTSTNTGTSGAAVTSSGCESAGNSAAKKRRRIRYSTATAASHGTAISTVNRVNDSPATAKASRLVRFDTGNSSDAVLARCALA